MFTCVSFVSGAPTLNRRPMRRLVAYKVDSGLVTDCRFATSPTNRVPSGCRRVDTTNAQTRDGGERGLVKGHVLKLSEGTVYNRHGTIGWRTAVGLIGGSIGCKRFEMYDSSTAVVASCRYSFFRAYCSLHGGVHPNTAVCSILLLCTRRRARMLLQ